MQKPSLFNALGGNPQAPSVPAQQVPAPPPLPSGGVGGGLFQALNRPAPMPNENQGVPQPPPSGAAMIPQAQGNQPLQLGPMVADDALSKGISQAGGNVGNMNFPIDPRLVRDLKSIRN